MTSKNVPCCCLFACNLYFLFPIKGSILFLKGLLVKHVIPQFQCRNVVVIFNYRVCARLIVVSPQAISTYVSVVYKLHVAMDVLPFSVWCKMFLYCLKRRLNLTNEIMFDGNLAVSFIFSARDWCLVVSPLKNEGRGVRMMVNW